MLLLDLETIAVGLVVVDFNALFNKSLLFILVYFVFATMPNVNSVFLPELVFRFSSRAKH